MIHNIVDSEVVVIGLKALDPLLNDLFKRALEDEQIPRLDSKASIKATKKSPYESNCQTCDSH